MSWARLWALATVVAVLGCSRHASAETKRLAVLIGNNAGATERAPLRYAESDAGKLAQTLVELGGVDPAQLFLLQGKSLGAVRDVLGRVRARVTALHADLDVRVVLIFYFSGHSDGESLELGQERLSFTELRRALGQTGAEVRLAIVDSCQSGALLAAKGGRPGPAFQIRLAEDLASTGEALLASSAADELALESREIRGSFFTHHLVSGLRGAADTSGDGAVTLSEAYQYAFAHTVSATAGTLVGTQHPSYDYRLSGQGELVLTNLVGQSATLELPRGFERILVSRVLQDQVVAEVPSGAAIRVSLARGDYAVRAWQDGRLFAARITLRDGETRRLLHDELTRTTITTPRVQSKGGEPVPVHVPSVSLVVAAGAQGGSSVAVPAVGTLRLGVRSARPTGWAAALDVSLGRGPGYWESTAIAYGGYRLGFDRPHGGAFIGFEVGVGVVSQDSDTGPSGRSATVVGAPWLGGTVRLSPRVLLALEAHVPLGWIRRDGHDALAFLPAGWVGFSVTP